MYRSPSSSKDIPKWYWTRFVLNDYPHSLLLGCHLAHPLFARLVGRWGGAATGEEWGGTWESQVCSPAFYPISDRANTCLDHQILFRTLSPAPQHFMKSLASDILTHSSIHRYNLRVSIPMVVNNACIPQHYKSSCSPPEMNNHSSTSTTIHSL